MVPRAGLSPVSCLRARPPSCGHFTGDIVVHIAGVGAIPVGGWYLVEMRKAYTDVQLQA